MASAGRFSAEEPSKWVSVGKNHLIPELRKAKLEVDLPWVVAMALPPAAKSIVDDVREMILQTV